MILKWLAGTIFSAVFAATCLEAAAPVFDAATCTSVDPDSTTGTVAFTVGSGSNRALAVCVGSNPRHNNVTGITYDGVSMTLLQSQDDTSNLDYYQGSVWGLLSPHSGTHNIVVTLTTTGAFFNISAYSVSGGQFPMDGGSGSGDEECDGSAAVFLATPDDPANSIGVAWQLISTSLDITIGGDICGPTPVGPMCASPGNVGEHNIILLETALTGDWAGGSICLQEATGCITGISLGVEFIPAGGTPTPTPTATPTGPATSNTNRSVRLRAYASPYLSGAR